jgi:uncharacterized lipoprotein NlpE involved in copper resistance
MKKSAVVALAVSLGLGGLYVVQEQSKDCVTLYVDYGPLGNGTQSTSCIPVSSKTNALDLLADAGLIIEGTQKYGNAIVCRINNRPDATTESCQEMPPAEAYWAVLVKEHEILPIPFNTAGVWGWAQTGINEVYLEPGDAIGLVFADNGEVRFP